MRHSLRPGTGAGLQNRHVQSDRMRARGIHSSLPLFSAGALYRVPKMSSMTVKNGVL